MEIRIFGLHILDIERKTDILAFAAFIISLGGVIYQVTDFFRGAKVTLIPPEQLLIRTMKYDNENRYIVFSLPIAYVNSGGTGHNAVIKKELISVKLAGQDYSHSWQLFINTWSEGKKLVFDKQKKGANAFVLNAGSAVAHETEYAPRKEKCLIESNT